MTEEGGQQEEHLLRVPCWGAVADKSRWYPSWSHFTSSLTSIVRPLRCEGRANTLKWGKDMKGGL